MNRRVRINGMGTLEVLLSMSLFMLYATFVMGAMLFSLQSTKTPNTRREALYYAEQGLDVVTYLKKDSLSNLSDGVYGIAFSSGDWGFIPNQDTAASGFIRTLTISTVDVDTKKVLATVTWDNGVDTGFEELVSYVTNWNEMIQQPGGWVTPILAATYNSPANFNPMALRVFNGDLNVVADNNTVYNLNISDIQNVSVLTSTAIGTTVTDVAFAGDKIYVSSSGNTSELRGMIITSPTSIQVYGTYNMATNTDALGIDIDGGNIHVTRSSSGSSNEYNTFLDTGLGVFTPVTSMNYASSILDVKSNGQYAYASVGVAGNDFIVINNTIPPTVANTYNTPAGNENVEQLIIGSYLYRLTASSGMLIYDISTPNAPVLVQTVSTGGAIDAFGMDTTNNYLFLGVANNGMEFQIFDVSAPANPTLLGFYDIAGNADVTSLTYDSVADMVILGTSSNQEELLFFTKQ